MTSRPSNPSRDQLFFFPCSLPWRLLRLSFVFITNKNRRTLFVREMAWSVSCSISLGGVFFFSPLQYLMRIWWRSVGGPEIDDQRRSFPPTRVQLNHGTVFFTSASQKVPLLMSVYDIVCLLDGLEEGNNSTPQVVLSEERALFIYWLCVFPRWLPRGLVCSSFLFVWSAISNHWIRLVLFSVFNSCFPCRSLLWIRLRSLFALLWVKTRNGALGLCARRVISDHKSVWL